MVIDKGSGGDMPVMLVVGDLREWSRKGRVLPVIEGFHFAGFHEVDADLLARIAPDVVLSALMADSFDALDLARRLANAGFRGRYRAVTNALPRPESIVAEVQAIAPEIDFDLYIIDTALRH